MSETTEQKLERLEFTEDAISEFRGGHIDEEQFLAIIDKIAPKIESVPDLPDEEDFDAIVPEEWVDAALKGAEIEALGKKGPRDQMRRALEAVVPLAEQRATRSLLKAREETEGR